MAYSISGSSDTASNTRWKTPAFTHSRKRLKTEFHLPNNADKSRHGLPVRAIQSTASVNNRASPVATTGIYCRPSCPSRTANLKNVGLHDTLAKATGCRPCKRCNPDGLSLDAEHAVLIAKACRLIEQGEGISSLTELAGAVELSPATSTASLRPPPA
jgi:hypothetical protein